MATAYALPERTRFSARPGGTWTLDNPLNQGDSVDLVIDWTGWLGSESVSSAAWDADSGITLSGTTVTSKTTPVTVTAGTSSGKQRAEVKMTTDGGQVRSMLLVVEVVNLK